jgi:hypothetical protein
MSGDHSGLGNGHDQNDFFYRDPFDPNPDANGANGATDTPPSQDDDKEAIVCAALEPIPITGIPPRAWAYGNFLLFGHASALAAVDGGGKGAYAVAIACAMITGQPLLGEKVWRSGPVVVLTYEDDKTEWQRRIAVACLHFCLDYESICRGFHFIYRPRGRIALAAHSINGRTVVFPDHAAIVTHLTRIKAALFVVDPFNHAHALDDGNSNALIAQLAAEIDRIAAETKCAVLVLHHLRKGATGELDDMMGATALRATFRATRILVGMSKEQAGQIGIDPDEVWRYRRIASSTENYSPPADRAQWFRLESRELGNVDVDPTYPEGDNVQVFILYRPTAAIDDMPKSVIAAIFDKIRRGPEAGEHYHFIRQSKRWVGTVISELADINEDQAKTVIDEWTKDRDDGPVLIKGDYTSRQHKSPIGCVRLNEEQARKILEGYRPPASESPTSSESHLEPQAAENRRRAIAENAAWEAQATKRAKLSGLPTTARFAFQILTKTIEHDGETPSPDPEIPSDTRCLRLESWRERYCAASPIERARNQQTAFVRAVEKLLVEQVIARQGEWVWPL